MRPRSPGQKRILAMLADLPLNQAARGYLESRGLLEVATDLRFGAVPDSPAPRLRQYAGRLVIPSIGPAGNVYDVAFRCIQDHGVSAGGERLDCSAAECKKYLFLAGLDKRLYNLRALASAGDTIEITEGQLDAATLVACGLHAVGVAGANGWKSYHPRLFHGYDRVRVWGDGDVAGKDFATRVGNVVAGSDVMMVPWGYDVNTLYVEQGRDAILKIAEGEEDDDHDDTDGWGLEPEWEHDSPPPPF